MIRSSFLAIALSLSAGVALAGPAPLQNTTITGSDSFAPDTLASIDWILGGAAMNVAHLDPNTIEFITVDADNTFAFDFTPAGLVTVFSNLPNAWTSPANEVFNFSFDGLSSAITGFSLVGDLSQVSSGLSASNLSFTNSSVGIDLSNITFTPNATFTAQMSFAAAVPEPSTYAMLLAGLGIVGFAGLRRRQL